jgi:hypothetical protein
MMTGRFPPLKNVWSRKPLPRTDSRLRSDPRFPSPVIAHCPMPNALCPMPSTLFSPSLILASIIRLMQSMTSSPTSNTFPLFDTREKACPNEYSVKEFNTILNLAKAFHMKCKVTSAFYLKGHDTWEHEALLFQLVHPDDPGRKSFVVAHRTVHSEGGLIHSSRIASPSNSPAPGSERPSSESKPAFDSVLVYHDIKSIYFSLRDPDTILAATFSTPPSVLQLSLLLNVVSTSHSIYNLASFQCYWFAKSIWDALHTEFGGRNERNSPRNGTILSGRGMNIELPIRINTHEVLAKYHAQWEEIRVRHSPNTFSAFIDLKSRRQNLPPIEELKRTGSDLKMLRERDERRRRL